MTDADRSQPILPTPETPQADTPRPDAAKPGRPWFASWRSGVSAIALMAIGAGAVLTLQPHVVGAQGKSSETYRQLNLFGEVFERVRADYVDQVSDEQLVEAAINGMLSSLDPHSSYLNTKSYKDMQVQTRGEFGGLGIEVTMENGLVKVVSPIDDTPAFRAGVKSGDYITHLNNDPVLGLSLNEAVEKMRGPVDSPLKLTIRREGRDTALELTVTRAVIKIQSVRSRLEGDIAYVRITTFNEQTGPGLEKAMASLKEQAGSKLKGVVLDLRDNPGGLLDQAISVSDAFLDKGEIVSTRGRRSEETQRFNAKVGDLAGGLPIVVLINTGSASASEIVAGALQDHHRAVLVGTKSFGKGSVQTIMPLQGHGAMRLTTARYYTPSGRSIQQVGIEPDIEIQQAKLESLEQGQRRRESDLRGSLRNPNGTANGATPSTTTTTTTTTTTPAAPAGAAPGTPAPGTTAAEPPQDYQLARALDLLRGVALFNTRTTN
jgi:carboxyl-terminal processing protease